MKFSLSSGLPPRLPERKEMSSKTQNWAKFLEKLHFFCTWVLPVKIETIKVVFLKYQNMITNHCKPVGRKSQVNPEKMFWRLPLWIFGIWYLQKGEGAVGKCCSGLGENYQCCENKVSREYLIWIKDLDRAVLKIQIQIERKCE